MDVGAVATKKTPKSLSAYDVFLREQTAEAKAVGIPTQPIVFTKRGREQVMDKFGKLSPAEQLAYSIQADQQSEAQKRQQRSLPAPPTPQPEQLAVMPRRSPRLALPASESTPSTWTQLGGEDTLIERMQGELQRSV